MTNLSDGIFPKLNGNPLQYSYLKNPIEWGAWWATVQSVAESQYNWAYFPLLGDFFFSI